MLDYKVMCKQPCQHHGGLDSQIHALKGVYSAGCLPYHKSSASHEDLQSARLSGLAPHRYHPLQSPLPDGTTML